MSSSAQIAANQENAQSSSGPRTPEGKAASSLNAISHGLTGAFRVLPHEDQNAYDVSLSSYMKEFQAESEHERFLVELMTQARWELQRTNRLITCVLERLSQAESSAASPDDAIAAAIIARSADAWTTLKRYAAASERTYLRCSRELTQRRDRRAKEAAALFEAKLCARVNEPHPAPVRNEPNRPLRNEPIRSAQNTRPTRKPIPGVAFTDKDPLSWRL
jgi:hypothetical protein